MLKRTPLYSSHVQLGARMVPFAGFEMPVQYRSVIDEAKAVRSRGGLFDVSHMGQFRVSGKTALSQLQRLVSNDLSRLKLGQAQYCLLCNESGGIIDDWIVYWERENTYFICVNASNRTKDWEWVQTNLKSDLSIEDLSDATALIAVQGPMAESLLGGPGKCPEVLDLNYYWSCQTQTFGIPVFLSRTGYTGEDGFELYVENRFADRLWSALLESGRELGIEPAGLGARDTLRIEMGYPLHGQEIAPDINPFEAGLGWVVKIAKPGGFIGSPALEDQLRKGVRRTLVGLTMGDRRIPRTGYVVGDKHHKPVGKVTSGTLSVGLGQPVALALVDPAATQLDTDEYQIQIRNDWVPARKTPLPFVPAKTRKVKRT